MLLNQLALETLKKRLEPIALVKKPETGKMPRAAVAVILNALEEEFALLLVRRTIRQRDPWSGQIAFPGGHMTSQDSTLLDTAIRETREEVGISLLNHELLGRINDAHSRRRELVVTPFVASLRWRRAIVLQREEVAEATWVPINNLQKSPSIRRCIKTSEGELEADGIPYGDQIIWGLTLRIINDLLSRLDHENE